MKGGGIIMKKVGFVLIVGSLVLGMVGWGAAQSAPKFPTKALTLICPASPGGNSDATVRILALTAPKFLGQSVLVVTKAGAAGSIAHAAFKDERPDGYALIFAGGGALTVYPYLNKVTYDPVNDFEFIARMTKLANVVVVGKNAKWRTMTEFIDFARANPGKMKVGTSGPNSGDELMLRRMNQKLGIKLVPVGFGSSGEGNLAIMGGHVDAGFAGIVGARPLIDNGSLRALAIDADKRDPVLKDVPTFAELKITGTLNTSSIGIAAPKGTPKEIVTFLEDAFKKTVEDPVTIALGQRMGLVFAFQNGADFKKSIADEGEQVKELLAAGL
jgi:tripartite-type tricarboxylate transporter receptor subunit TctC